MTIQDDYLDALAIVQARVDKDTEARDTILTHTEPVGLIFGLIELCINAGGQASGTPGNPAAWIADTRIKIQQGHAIGRLS